MDRILVTLFVLMIWIGAADRGVERAGTLGLDIPNWVIVITAPLLIGAALVDQMTPPEPAP